MFTMQEYNSTNDLHNVYCIKTPRDRVEQNMNKVVTEYEQSCLLVPAQANPLWAQDNLAFQSILLSIKATADCHGKEGKEEAVPGGGAGRAEPRN